MFAALSGSLDGIGLTYACTMLQLSLSTAFLLNNFTFLVGINAQLKKKLQHVPWQPAVQAMAAAAGPAVLLALVALIQTRAQAMNLFSLVALSVAGASVLIGTLSIILVPICGGNVPVVDGATGDITDHVSENEADEATTAPVLPFIRLARLMRFLKGIGLLLLLLAAAPEDTQLACASVLARLALLVEGIVAIGRTFGGDSTLVEAGSDAARALSLTPLLGGLAILDYNVSLGASLFYIPLTACALCLSAKVALIMVLHFGCGGGVEAGCSAESYISGIHFAANGGFTLGLFGCILNCVYNSYEFTVSQTSFYIQWGDPMVATAIVLASISFLAQFLDLFAPGEQLEEDTETNGSVIEAHAGENGACTAKPVAPQGISAPMKAITSRVPGLVLALAMMQSGVSQPSNFGFLENVLASLSVPFKFGFCPCAIAMKIQIAMLLVYVISNCERDPIPEPILDGTGTLVWDAESQTARGFIMRIRNVVLVLSQVGLLMGMLAMGVLPWIPMNLILIFIVYPCLPTEGKSNISQGFGWAGLALQSCGGIIGEKVASYLAQRREMAKAAAEAMAAKKAAEIEAETEEDNAGNAQSNEARAGSKKVKGEPGEFKKKQPNPSPKKATGSKPKKKGK